MSTCERCNRDLPRCQKCGASPWQAKRRYVYDADLLLATCACGFEWSELPLDRQERAEPPTTQELLEGAAQSLGIELIEGLEPA